MNKLKIVNIVLNEWKEKQGWNISLYGRQIERYQDLTNVFAKTLWEKQNTGGGMQTDRLGVGEGVQGGLSLALWGLQSFCSPPTPDLLPPDSSPVTNLHFLCIQCPPTTSFCFLRRSSLNQRFQPPYWPISHLAYSLFSLLCQCTWHALTRVVACGLGLLRNPQLSQDPTACRGAWGLGSLAGASCGLWLSFLSWFTCTSSIGKTGRQMKMPLSSYHPTLCTSENSRSFLKIQLSHQYQ